MPMLRAAERPVTGLEISSGQVAAVKVKGGGRQVESAGIRRLPDGVVRDGEVVDPQALAEALHELFAATKLPHAVRVGITNQSTVMRVVSLPLAIDKHDIAEAVRFQMPETIPLPADDVVFSHHVLGPGNTPAGRKMRVVVVAARRQMVDDVLAAVRGAGLKPVGIDLSSFALIRTLYVPTDAGGPVAYLGVGDQAHLSVAIDGLCVFSRVLSSGEDAMASQLLGRLGLARDRSHQVMVEVGTDAVDWPQEDDSFDPDTELMRTVRDTIIDGVGRLANDTRATLDFYPDQDSGIPASKVVVSGPAAAIPGFVDRLSEALATPVESRVMSGALPPTLDGIDASQLQVALGLTVSEIPR